MMHPYHFMRNFLGIVLLLPHAISCQALTYWKHMSCGPYDGVDRAIEEAIFMAGKADARLGDSNDGDIATTFFTVFRTETSNADPFKRVRGILSGISQFTAVPTREDSDIRIYCDQDDRWTLQDDRKEDEVKNSQRDKKKQIWQDEVNKIRYRGPPGCKDGNTLAEVFDRVWRNSGQEREGRATMTICDPDRYAKDNLNTLEEQGDKDFSELSLSDGVLSELLSVTFLHEFTHVPRYDTRDFEYGWEKSIGISVGKAIRNADSYAFFGLLSLLLDKGFMLSAVEAEAQIGTLVRTVMDNTKRWINNKLRKRCRQHSFRWSERACGFFDVQSLT